MTDKEVLQKAIEIAIENGYKHLDKFLIQEYNDEIINITPLTTGRMPCDINHSTFIFSHDFAKAFFGEGKDISNKLTPFKQRFTVFKDNGEEFVNSKELYAWQYHLQQMVLEENPIDYLRKFVNTETSKTI